MYTQQENTAPPKVKIGFFDSEVGPPTYDDTTHCPVCGGSLSDTTREVITILIHCTRWPLCTFVKFHKDEISFINDSPRYQEIILEAFYERARIEKERNVIPDVIRNAFKHP